MADFTGRVLSEFERLRTFNDWPSNHQITPEKLSRDGFIYCGVEDKVECVLCHNVHHAHEFGDSPISDHKIRYPECTFEFEEIVRQPQSKDLEIVPIQESQHDTNINFELAQPRFNEGPIIESFATSPLKMGQIVEDITDGDSFFSERGDVGALQQRPQQDERGEVGALQQRSQQAERGAVGALQRRQQQAERGAVDALQQRSQQAERGAVDAAQQRSQQAERGAVDAAQQRSQQAETGAVGALQQRQQLAERGAVGALQQRQQLAERDVGALELQQRPHQAERGAVRALGVPRLPQNRDTEGQIADHAPVISFPADSEHADRSGRGSAREGPIHSTPNDTGPSPTLHPRSRLAERGPVVATGILPIPLPSTSMSCYNAEYATTVSELDLEDRLIRCKECLLTDQLVTFLPCGHVTICFRCSLRHRFCPSCSCLIKGSEPIRLRYL